MREGRGPVDRIDDVRLLAQRALNVRLILLADGLLADDVNACVRVLETIGEERLDLAVGLRDDRVVALVLPV